MLNKLKGFWKADEKIIKYIFTLFVVSRVVLTIVGFLSKETFQSQNPRAYTWSYSDVSLLDIWGVWDSGYYLDIAKRGYSNDQNFEFNVSIIENEFGLKQTNLGFFPLYPILIKSVSLIVGNYYLASLIVSNIFLLLSSYVLYKLGKIEFGEDIAKKSVRFLYLFPTAFIYSGVFTESVALFFIILSLLFASTRQWILAGLSAALLSLTKFSGFVTAISILIKAFAGKKTKMKELIIGLLFIPLSLGFFFSFLKIKFGDPFISFTTKISGWNIEFDNPLSTSVKLFDWGNLNYNLIGAYQIISIFLIFEVILLIYSFRKIPFYQYSLWLIFIIMTLVSGLNVSIGIPRHVLIIAPQFYAIALICRNKSLDYLMTGIFAVLQLAFMALWVNGIALM